MRRLDDAEIAIADVALHRPTLDDVFLALTGHATEEGTVEEDPPSGRRGRRRKAKEESPA